MFYLHLLKSRRLHGKSTIYCIIDFMLGIHIVFDNRKPALSLIKYVLKHTLMGLVSCLLVVSRFSRLDEE